MQYHYLFSQFEPEGEGEAERDEGQGEPGDDRSTDSGSPSPDIAAVNGGFDHGTPRAASALEPSGTESSFLTLSSDEAALLLRS